MNKSQKSKIETVKKALAKYGIYTEKDLDEAIKNMEPLNIGCMVSPTNKSKQIEDVRILYKES